MIEVKDSIGLVHEKAYEAACEADNGPSGNRVSEDWDPAARYETWVEAGAKAVLLYALDLMASAGITPSEAAAQLRAGRTIEEVCAERIEKTRGTEKQRAEFMSTMNEADPKGGPVVYQCPICLDIAMVVERKDTDAHPTECVVEVDGGKVRAGKCGGKHLEMELCQELKQAFLDNAPDSGCGDDGCVKPYGHEGSALIRQGRQE